MNCQMNAEGLNAYVDDLLFPSEKEAVERHLAQCERCRDTVAALQEEVDALMAALGTPGLTPMMPYAGARRSWGARLARVAALAALVFATSLTTIALDRLLAQPEPNRLALGSRVTLSPAPKVDAPRLTICVRREAREWRVVPASFVLPPGGWDIAAGEEIEL